MTVEEIPADEVIEMSIDFDRAFRHLGCKPMCHHCKKKVAIGDKFKLATLTTAVHSGSNDKNTLASREVMLCMNCKAEDYETAQRQIIKDYEEYREQGYGCFRVNGKIVTYE